MLAPPQSVTGVPYDSPTNERKELSRLCQHPCTLPPSLKNTFKLDKKWCRHAHVCMCACAFVCVCACDARLCTSLHVCACVRMCVCTMYVYVRVRTCVYVCMCCVYVGILVYVREPSSRPYRTHPSRAPYRTELIPRAPKGRRTRPPHP